jgi:hypothetical protein
MPFKKGNKLGKFNKGKPHKPQQGFQKGNNLWNNPNAEKTRFKKGQIMPFEIRQKIAKAISGEKHYLWNGGKNLKHRIRGCFKYRQWRSDIFTRDDFTCQICDKRGGYLEADHNPKLFSEIIKEYKITTLEQSLECEELWNINNGRTLCRKCHDKTKIWWKKKTKS